MPILIDTTNLPALDLRELKIIRIRLQDIKRNTRSMPPGDVKQLHAELDAVSALIQYLERKPHA